MKFLYVTDLHGNIWKLNLIFEIARSLKVKTVINGGDILPMGNLLKQDDFIVNFLDTYFKKFDSEKINLVNLLGNDDVAIFDDLFEKICNKYSYIFSNAQRIVKVEDYEFIGTNYVIDYPFALKDRCRMDDNEFILPRQFGKPVISTLKGWSYIDDWVSYIKNLTTIEEELNNLIRPNDFQKTIYIIHNPPSNLGLDVCSDGRRVGSKAVYNFIKKNQPLLTLHGHIHESPQMSGIWCSKIDNTICIQPGQSQQSQDFLIYVLVDLKEMIYERYIIDKFNNSFI